MTQPLRMSFQNASAATEPKYPRPFSLRLSEDERAILRHRAGKRSMGEYIRSKLFGDDATPRKVKRRNPTDTDQERAAQLAGLGQSRLASNMNQIAKAANMGALPVTPDLVDELYQACADIAAMRRALIAALGLKPQEGAPPPSYAKATEG